MSDRPDYADICNHLDEVTGYDLKIASYEKTVKSAKETREAALHELRGICVHDVVCVVIADLNDDTDDHYHCLVCDKPILAAQLREDAVKVYTRAPNFAAQLVRSPIVKAYMRSLYSHNTEADKDMRQFAYWTKVGAGIS